MNAYSHTQRAGRWLYLLVAAAVVFAAVAWTTRLWPILLTVPGLAIVGWLFGSLTIDVVDGELRWRFGPGLVRRRLSLGEIMSARAVTTRWYEGWGIHYTRHGWLHNIAGFRAVAISLKSGRRFALGTDEPERLLAALGYPDTARHEN